MSEWFQPQYVVSALALVVALVALVVSWSSAQEANRAADAARSSKNSAITSARAARQASEMVLEFVDLPVSRWLEANTALLCLEDVRRAGGSSGASSGFTCNLRNRGNAAASDIVLTLLIDGGTWSWETSVPLLNAGHTTRLRFPITDRRYLPLDEVTVVLRYQDAEMHEVVFILEKTPGEVEAPRLIAASLDGRHHPGHLTDES